MPFDQLRALVVAVIEADEDEDDEDDDDDYDDDDGDPVAEFEARPTTYRPTPPSRVRTLDEVIEAVIESLLRGY